MLLRHLFLLGLLLVLAPAAHAQQDYLVDDFSPTYFARIHIADTGHVFSPGRITIYNRKTREPVLKVESEELALILHAGKVRSNVQQLPYGEQSLIISRDFNFDGRPDLAICDGQNSCYYGPSFQVYLATPTGLTPSAAFTRLAQEYCGMFETDAKARRLRVMTKSGCCWHESSEFSVRGNVPFLERRTEEDAMQYPFITSTTETWNGHRLVSTTARTLDLQADNVQVRCAFRLAETGRQVVLFTTDSTTLHYALLRPDKTVEFTFSGSADEDRPFRLRPNYVVSTTLSFYNGSALYSITEDDDAGQMRVEVTDGAKTRTLTGVAATKTGSLRALRTVRLDNVQRVPQVLR